ncbi:hypothetical protein AINA4_04820 [Aurantimicrobium sp. INA4]|uniref:GAP family protein n=1 Tax=Aurantimicrobium sp. INA4 TaxID=2986279 RepID=UPI002493BFB2|nr:GAP family protein [Aurantimicrobium sp. INA4]BDU10561.1 hypothetical protein AINA4_04820 [Aurantimicrobium sp. INA4]
MGKEEIELLFRVIPLAIGAAFTPSLFGLQLVAAVSPRWISRTIATGVGAGLAFAIAISLLLFGFASLPADNRGQDSPLSGAIWLIVGIVLGASATWLFMPHPELAKSSEMRLTAGLNKARPITFFGVAFALSIKDVTSFALLIPALHDIAASKVDLWFKIPTALLVYLIALIGVILPPIWRLIRGERAEELLDKMFRFTMDHQFKILGVVAVFFALYCIIIAAGTGKFGWIHW